MPPFPVLPYTDAPQQGAQDESSPEALVARLLASLERGTTEPPPALSGSRRLLGPLGDALMAAATVRAGGAPPQIGAFGAEQASRQAAYERRLEENARADRSLRNAVRIGAMQMGNRQMIGPLDQAKLDMDKQRLAEETRYHTGIINKPPAGAQINPETERHNREMERLADERLDKQKTARPLPYSLVSKLADQTAALEAAQAAKDAWTDLKKPDLGTIFNMTPDRLKNRDAIKARRAISEALVPLRKYFLGSAVSEGEKQAAAPLLANLEGGVAPNVLEESLVGLVNIADRARRNELTSAEMGGFDVSKFHGERGAATVNQPTVGTKKLRVVINENGDLKVDE